MTHLKKLIALILFLLMLTNLLGQTNNFKFRIDGKVQGYNDGTKLYLNDLSLGNYEKQIDSTIILNNKFSFRGNLKSKYLQTNISTTDFNDRVSFWLETGTTTFFGEKGNFRMAKIAGTETQNKQNEFVKLLDTIENTETIEYNFIKKNPNSIISASILTSYSKRWSKDSVKSLYKLFPNEIKETFYGKLVKDYIELSKNLKVGDKFIDFIQKDTSGKNIKLSDFKGKLTLLEFWGSWCEACIEKHPMFINLYNEFHSKGFEIFEVAAETKKSTWIKAIKNGKLPWINVTELKGDKNKAAIIYGITEYPTNFLIDKNGIIVGQELYGEKLRNMILKYL